MRRPRLVASDVDGTLLGPDGHVSPRTRAAVARVEEGGALFVLVTGRPPRWLAPLRDELDHHGVAVCANGAVLYDLASGETLREDTLPGDVAEAMVQRLREEVPGVAFAVEGTSGFGHEPALPAALGPLGERPAGGGARRPAGRAALQAVGPHVGARGRRATRCSPRCTTRWGTW